MYDSTGLLPGFVLNTPATRKTKSVNDLEGPGKYSVSDKMVRKL